MRVVIIPPEEDPHGVLLALSAIMSDIGSPNTLRAIAALFRNAADECTRDTVEHAHYLRYSAEMRALARQMENDLNTVKEAVHQRGWI